MDKEQQKTRNKESIKQAFVDISQAESSKKIVTQPLEIITQKIHGVALSRVIIDQETAAKLGDQSLILQGADLGVRYSIHNPEAGAVLSAESALKNEEVAFLQMYFRYDTKKRQVTVTTYVEVADTYQDEDLQGYGLGTSFMPTTDLDIGEKTALSQARARFPEATHVVIALKDFAKGKGDKNRNQWTTNLAQKAGYTPHQGYLLKHLDLT